MSTDNRPTSQDELEAQSPFAPLCRAPYQLNSLPARFRWEVTRRHPYYLTSWLVVRSAHRHEPLADQTEELSRQFGMQLLRLIGVFGEPVDPGIEFDQLGSEELHSATLTGSVQPLTLRQLASLLIDSLPHEVLAAMGLRLCRAAYAEAGDPPHRQIAQLELATMGRELDAFPTEPYVWINPAASSRQVSRDISALLKDWKSRYGLKERRERSDQDYQNYLQVWDLREGWTGSGYHGSREITLESIAAQLQRALPTIASQYKSGFEMIVGQPFTLETWIRVFGRLKFSRIWPEASGWLSRRRLQKSNTQRPIPESTLKSGADGQNPGLATSVAESELKSDVAVAELFLDLRSQFAQGSSDEQIASELDLPVAMIAYLPQLRERLRS